MAMSDERRLPMAPSRPQGQPPIFEKIAIVGLGLIGGSISIAAKQTWPAGLVIAVDRKDVLEQAMEKGFGEQLEKILAGMKPSETAAGPNEALEAIDRLPAKTEDD